MDINADDLVRNFQANLGELTGRAVLAETKLETLLAEHQQAARAYQAAEQEYQRRISDLEAKLSDVVRPEPKPDPFG